MKYLIEKNVVIPVNKITDDIIEKSIKYTGFDFDGKDIEIYDLENGKLAPIVRYLIEGGEERRSKLIAYIGIFVLILFLIVIGFFVFGEEAEPKTEKLNDITQIKQNIETPKIVDSVNLEKENNEKIELLNEIDKLNGLKNEAEKETLRIINENDKKILQIERINNNLIDLNEENQKLVKTNEELQEKLKNLENNLKIVTQRKIEGPKDEFIYYLGLTTYERCESSLNDKILNNCKELYYNYLKYNENR